MKNKNLQSGFRTICLVALAFHFLTGTVPAQRNPDTTGRKREGRKNEDGRGNREAARFQTIVPDHPWDIVLGRPTSKSVTISVLAYADSDAAIAYGTERGKLAAVTPIRSLKKGQPELFQLTGLRPNTTYFYRFRHRPTGNGNLAESAEFSFTTARPAGSEFTFAIQADSHLDEGTDTETYKRSLENIAAARPDFLVDLGDTFMTDKYPDFRQSEAQYIAQRYYFGLVGPSVPIYLTLGNHDGEAGWRRDGDDMFAWSNRMRKKFFPNPEPNDFYSGNSLPERELGMLQNYFAWEWGDALFVVLDPFTYTTERSRGDDNWTWTLGRRQYDWLKSTVEASRAKYKFVFIHHLVGGGDRVARGGAEAARFFEWGGRGFDGNVLFADRRSGFSVPIHELFVRNGVSAVFHGHDHLYVKQDLDGIVYQEVPQPGHKRADNTRNAAEYGYLAGTVRGSSGVLIVRVTAKSAKVSYVRAFPNEREAAGRKNAMIDHEYEIFPVKR